MTLLKGVRDLPRQFWTVYGIMLGFVVSVGYAVTFHDGWFLVFIFLVAAWGIFAALRVTYRLGMIFAYRQASEWAEEARQSMLEGQSELAEIASRLDRIGQHFEGPS